MAPKSKPKAAPAKPKAAPKAQPKAPAKAQPKAKPKAQPKVQPKAAKPKPKAVSKKAPAKGKPQGKAKPKAKASKPEAGKPAIRWNRLFFKKTRQTGLARPMRNPKTDLTRWVRWPGYIRRQRKIRVLSQRLKVPPAIAQFRLTLNKNTRAELLKFAAGYKKETKKDRNRRLNKAAKLRLVDPRAIVPKRPLQVQCGMQHVTRLVEKKRAKLVLIASDVRPIELVVWLPTLCKKLEVPYVIIKTKSTLGQLCGRKNATCLAFTDIRPEDQPKFEKILESIKITYTDRFEEKRKQWGGLKLSRKSKKKAMAKVAERKKQAAQVRQAARKQKEEAAE